MSDKSIPFEDDLVELLLKRLQVNLTCENDGAGGLDITAYVFDVSYARTGLWGRKVNVKIIASQMALPPIDCNIQGSST